MASRIPALLEPCIQIVPQDSLILLTSTVSNSANWLVIRFLYGSLSNSNTGPPKDTSSTNDSIQAVENYTKSNKVVMVSWLREFEFWKIECRRTVGLDLTQLSQQGRFCFIDGLTNLFSGYQASSARGIQSPRGQPSTSVDSGQESHQLASTDLKSTGDHIISTLSSLSIEDPSVLLILDAPELLFATCPNPAFTLQELLSLLLRLRRHPSVHSTLITPSLSIALPTQDHHTELSPPAELDIAQKAFVIGLAHQANLVMQLRPLYTGAASDVTGVLRISKGGAESDDNGWMDEWREGELLYQVRPDGTVRVLERGEGVG